MRKILYNKCLILLCILFTVQNVVAQMGTIKGRVTNGTEALPGATISLSGQTILSDAKGKFNLSMRPGTYKIAVTYAGFVKAEREVTITSGSLHVLDFILQPSSELQNVIVIGSRSMKQRSNLNSPVPIDVIQVSRLPTRQVELTRLIENTIPSFTAAPHGFREGKQNLPISLRSLGPDHTLVLLNGRRLHTTASPWTFGAIGFGTVGVDMNAIQSAAIETVEVLRDGAAAQYGSDAVAGVVNLQLKKGTGVTSVQLHTGQYYKGDGEAFSFSINHGFKFLKKGFLNFTAGFRFNDYTQRNGVYDSTVYFTIPNNATAAQTDSIRNLDNQKVAERGFDRKNHRPIGDNKVFNTGIIMNGGYPLRKLTSLFWTIVQNYRFTKDISSNNYRYPFNNAVRINPLIYPDGFLPYIQAEAPNVSITGGIKGVTHTGWHWDAGTIYGKNSSIVEVSNSNNATQQYTDGINAPTSFKTGKQVFSQITNNINLSREFPGAIQSVKALTLAFGGEFRIDHYRIYEGEENSWKNYAPSTGKEGGSQGQSGFQPVNVVNKKRQVIGAYTEIEIEKTENLLLNLAARYEHYSDFGNSLAGKIALRYRFSNWLTWRSSFSNGFRAPALQQKYYSLITNAVAPGGTIVKSGTFQNDHDVVKALGISNLKPETALNFSTGFTSGISKNVSITIDAYWIQIKNRIIYSGGIPVNNTYPEVRTIVFNAGFTDVQNIRVFSNAVNTRTKGLDVVFAGKWSIGKSLLETSLAANFNETELYDSILYAKNLPDNERYRKLLVNREERCRITTAYPLSKIILNLTYAVGKWKLNSAFTRFGEVTQSGSDTIRNVFPTTYPDETYSPKVIGSLNICYSLKTWLAITVGGENIFNTYPDRLKFRMNTTSGLFIYNPNFAPFGINGGYYFMNMSIKL